MQSGSIASFHFNPCCPSAVVSYLLGSVWEHIVFHAEAPIGLLLILMNHHVCFCTWSYKSIAPFFSLKFHLQLPLVILRHIFILQVFEYFASAEKPDGELLMRPADLMRAVVPVFPPSESHFVREGYLIGERAPGELRCAPSEFFMLFDVNEDGLISFREWVFNVSLTLFLWTMVLLPMVLKLKNWFLNRYIFFVTLLSIPETSFSIAFKMFDIDHNG